MSDITSGVARGVILCAVIFCAAPGLAHSRAAYPPVEEFDELFRTVRPGDTVYVRDMQAVDRSAVSALIVVNFVWRVFVVTSDQCRSVRLKPDTTDIAFTLG